MEKTPFWKKTWFIIIALIFIPPLGIVLIWIAKKHWKSFIKIILSVFLGFWALMLGVVILLPADESVSTENDPTAVEEAYEEENTTKQITQNNENTTKPVASTTTPESTTETTTERTTKLQTTTTPTATAKTTTTVKPTAAQKETTTKQTTVKPTTTKVPTTVDPESKITVYITKTGKRYHYENPCGNGTYYAATLAEAKSLGLTPCDKCVLH